MSKYIVFSTVGTSIQTTDNGLPLNDFSNDAFFDNWRYDKSNFEGKKEGLSAIISQKLSDDNLSAEIRSLTKLYEKLKKDEGDDVALDVHLLCTDTIISPVCAWCIQQWFVLNKEKYNEITVNFKFNENYVIRDLRVTESKEQMENGFLCLLKKIKQFATIEIKEDTPDGNYYTKKVVKEDDVILNVTGGYKAIIPYMTIISAIYGWELVYTYEDENAPLLEISDLPLQFDTSVAEIYYPLMQEGFYDDKDFIEENIDMYSDLIDYKLMYMTESYSYRPTALGNIFIDYIENKSQMGHDDILSFVVEMKVFEYRHRKKYVNGDKQYEFTKHSEVLPNNISEIDILLQTADFKNAVITEVKAIGSIAKAITQSEKQIDYLKNNQNRYGKPTEYHLVTYSVIEKNSKQIKYSKSTIEKNIAEIKKVVENKGLIFKCYYYKVFTQENWQKDKNKRLKTPLNVYQKFVQTKINNLEEI